jgi:hypothetical protein
MTARYAVSVAAGCVLFLAASAVAQPELPQPGLPKMSPKGLPPVPDLPAPGLLQARPGDDPVRLLKIERHNALLELLARYEALFRINGGSREDVDAYMQTLTQFTDARVELESDPAVRIAALKVLVEKFREHEKNVLRRVEQGTSPPQTAVRARIARLEAEIKLAQATADATTGAVPSIVPAVLPVCPPSRPALRPLWRR